MRLAFKSNELYNRVVSQKGVSSMASTVAAISTPQNTGSIGIIRISGEDAITIADRVFEPTGKRRLTELEGYRAAHGFVVYEGERLDECVALVFRAPKSYTGENVVELSCHGGLFVLKKVLRAVFSCGAAPAGPGEFTRRAFLNGKLDLTEAEAVMELINAQNEQGAKASLSALEGALSKKIDALSGRLISASAQLSAWVDYPDDEIEELQEPVLSKMLCEVEASLSSLLERFDAGAAVTRGVETAIIGKPNVGKSALMNLLSGYEKSIVTGIEGTTRDIVEGTVNLGALVLRLADTAGIRSTGDEVEQLGVERAKARLERAGLVFAVFDLSRPLGPEDEEIIALCKGKRVIAVLNKNDLPTVADEARLKKLFPVHAALCALDGDGLAQLEEKAELLLCTKELDTSQAILSTERQRKNAESALSAVRRARRTLESGITLDAVNVCIDDAIGFLLELKGEKAGDAVIDEVFSSFCVGK